MPYPVGDSQLALARVLEDPALHISSGVRTLAQIAWSLAAVPDPEIDPVFIERLENRILSAPAMKTGTLDRRASHLHALPDLDSISAKAEAQMQTPRPATEATAVTVPAPPLATVVSLPRHRLVVRKALIGAIAAVLALALPVLASAAALPGTPLYGLKGLMERAELATAGGPVETGFVHVKLAARRLDEVDQLVALHTVRFVPPTLERLDASLQAATTLILDHTNSPDALRRLANALNRSHGKLSSLLRQVPPGIQPSFIESLVSANALTRAVERALTPISAPLVQSAPSGAHANETAVAGVALPALQQEETISSSKAVVDPDNSQSAQGSRNPRTSDGVESHQTETACLTTLYAGPGHETADGLCGAAAPAHTTMPVPQP